MEGILLAFECGRRLKREVPVELNVTACHMQFYFFCSVMDLRWLSTDVLLLWRCLHCVLSQWCLLSRTREGN